MREGMNDRHWRAPAIDLSTAEKVRAFRERCRALAAHFPPRKSAETRERKQRAERVWTTEE
jgi:hypothetical protein